MKTNFLVSSRRTPTAPRSNRPGALLAGLAGISVSLTLAGAAVGQAPPRPPNVILLMADDMGWGDPGYNGGAARTPALDRMAAEGLRFNRFYSGAPVCSPTRGSCLTGRHPFRYGIFNANYGHLPASEPCMGEILKQGGYRTGHFGKWHLGTLTRDELDGNRGGRADHAENYMPPWEHGFDTCFSTEVRMPTWDPLLQPAQNNNRWWNPVDRAKAVPFVGSYWTGPGMKARGDLTGSDSRLIADRAIEFIRGAAAERKPFVAVVWFHASHWPVVSGSPYRDLYAGQSDYEASYRGCISDMDAEIGRLRRALAELGQERNTLVAFCADNGPEGRADRDPGSAGPLRGRKRDIYEGGVRVPGVMVWPGRISAGAVSELPASTLDYLPTVLQMSGLRHPKPEMELDGVSLVPLFEGKMPSRGRPIPFAHADARAVTDDRFKLVVQGRDGKPELYDIPSDPGEKHDLAGEHPAEVARLLALLRKHEAGWLTRPTGRRAR